MTANLGILALVALNLNVSALAGGMPADATPRLHNTPQGVAVEVNLRDAQNISEHMQTIDTRGKSPSLFQVAGDVQSGKSCWNPPQNPKIPTVKWWDLINPIWWFGNDDDPTPPEWYRPGEAFRETLWYFRNPLHNFTFYVIGARQHSNDDAFVRCGDYPADVFAPVQGWNFAVIKYKGLRLPFVSYWNKDFKFYLGWRERGNFGMKYNRVKDPAKNQ